MDKLDELQTPQPIGRVDKPITKEAELLDIKPYQNASEYIILNGGTKPLLSGDGSDLPKVFESRDDAAKFLKGFGFDLDGFTLYKKIKL